MPQPELEVLVETANARVTEVYAITPEPEQPVNEPVVASQPGTLNPLTGLPSSQPELLERRPVLVKVQNLPRPRQQWGVSFADVVYEYYTEFGTTRFGALYYGQNPDMVAPIRSARWLDMHLVRMYGAIFVFGSAYADLMDALYSSDFKDRALIEHPDTCPAICRYDPNGKNYLMTRPADLQGYIAGQGINNTPPDLSGMYFDTQAPQGGDPANRVFARFSTAVYNRWDYDPATGRYLRFSDVENAKAISDEQYEPLVDQLTGQQIGAENVVMILAEYELLVKTESSEVFDVALEGTGMAYIARDGKLYGVRWERPDDNSPLTLVQDDGSPFPFKPGQTWFEVVGLHTDIQRDGDAWRFQHLMP